MRVFVEILESMVLEEPKMFTIEQTIQMLDAVVCCMSINRNSAKLMPKVESEEATDDLKSCFLHLWLFIAY